MSPHWKLDIEPRNAHPRFFKGCLSLYLFCFVFLTKDSVPKLDTHYIFHCLLTALYYCISAHWVKKDHETHTWDKNSWVESDSTLVFSRWCTPRAPSALAISWPSPSTQTALTISWKQFSTNTASDFLCEKETVTLKLKTWSVFERWVLTNVGYIHFTLSPQREECIFIQTVWFPSAACKSHPCLNNGKCKEVPNGNPQNYFRCNCASGFKGFYCETGTPSYIWFFLFYFPYKNIYECSGKVLAWPACRNRWMR